MQPSPVPTPRPDSDHDAAKAYLEADIKATRRGLAFQLDPTTALGAKLMKAMAGAEPGHVKRAALDAPHSLSFISSSGHKVGEKLYVIKGLDLVRTADKTVFVLGVYNALNETKQRLPIVVLEANEDAWVLRDQRGSYNKALLEQTAASLPIFGVDVVFLDKDNPRMKAQRPALQAKGIQIGPDSSVTQVELMDGSIVSLVNSAATQEISSIKLPARPITEKSLEDSGEIELEPRRDINRWSVLQKRTHAIELSLRTLISDEMKISRDQHTKDVLKHVLDVALTKFRGKETLFEMTDTLCEIFSDPGTPEAIRGPLLKLMKKWAKDGYGGNFLRRYTSADYFKHVDRAHPLTSAFAASDS